MDIKTRLENEILFNGSNQTIRILKKSKIFSIEDFIYLDIRLIGRIEKSKLRALQKILKYKYLNIPLIMDVLLEKEYSSDCLKDPHLFEIRKDIRTLGFVCNTPFSICARTLIEKNGTCKLIDILLKVLEESTILENITIKGTDKSILNFYIEYYNSHIITENLKSANGENNREILVALKSELTCLVNQRNELDEKTSDLEQQISTLEGGTVINGRN